MTHIAIDFYPRPRRAKTASDAAPPDGTTPVASVPSSLRFQLSHMLADLALRAARHVPRLAPGVYPVAHAWKPDLTVELSATIDGHELRRTYKQTALRGDETLIRWLASAADPIAVVKKYRSLMYVGRPLADGERPATGRSNRFRLRAVDRDEAELSIRVEDYGALPAVDLGSLPQLGGKDFRRADLPVIVPRALLVKLAADEAARPEPFVERGWYLLGRIGRSAGELCVVVDDVVAARHTEGTDTSLDWSAATKIALVDELDRRRELGTDQRVVGWIHSHGPILEANEEMREALSRAAAKAGPIDFRFFSRTDVTMHRKDFGPAAIALVLDAAAARTDPNDPERCFACFATIDGIVARRGVYLTDRPIGEEARND